MHWLGTTSDTEPRKTSTFSPLPAPHWRRPARCCRKLRQKPAQRWNRSEPSRSFGALARRGDETCIVDLVIDRAPIIDDDKPVRDGVRVDSLREIAANKLCAVIGRAEIKDLVDLQVLLTHGIELGAAVLDAEKKDAGADPATIAWVVSQIKIGPDALLPGNADPIELDRFRTELVERLQVLAYERTGRTRD